MFEKILLTLDGSELAETAIPYVRNLVTQLDAEIFLLHVCPPEHQAYLHMHQIYMNYLADGMRSGRTDNNVPSGAMKIHVEAVAGDPVKIILEYIRLRDIGLVVMTSHGTSGLRQWAMGSVADKILRSADVPTLLVRIKDKPTALDQRGEIKRILVPLDNTDPSKIAIPYARALAQKLKASVILFSMARTIYAQNVVGLSAGVGGGVGVNWDSLDATAEKAAGEYLQDIENDLIKEGISASHTAYLGIDAAYEILEMEKKTQADLVVMATRGRSPAARWVFGSTAEKVLREGNLPMLLVREKTE